LTLSRSLVPQCRIKHFAAVKLELLMRFTASPRVGHLMYWVGESGHNISGFRYRPLLSHRMIVSIGLALLPLLSSFSGLVGVCLGLLSSFCGVVHVGSGWFLSIFSRSVSSDTGRLVVFLSSMSKLFDVGML
jgi:hypothetical protein